MKTYAVTSGKGGVGKTNISANLAIALAERSQKVLVFDADIGLANLDVILGIKCPYKLQHVLMNEKRLSEIIQKGPGGIQFVAGGSGIESLVEMDGPAGDIFLSELVQIEEENDILIFDTGAGLDENVMKFLSVADEILLVITPDPASMTDSYATAKAIFKRKPMASIKVIMNMVDDEAEAKAVYARMNSVCQEFIGRSLGFAGYVRMDSKATAYIRQRKPFIIGDPRLDASQDVARMAARLLGDVYIASGQSLADRIRNLYRKTVAVRGLIEVGGVLEKIGLR